MAQPTRILLALSVGLLLGIGFTATADSALAAALVKVAEPVAGLWLNALRMTIIPLLVALLITGIAATAEAARAGRLATRALILMLVILWSSSLIGALALPVFLSMWPLPLESALALRAALGSTTSVGPVPGIGQFLAGLIPTNPIAAAAGDAILPLIFFTTLFAFAITRLPPEPRRHLTGFFSAISDTMLVIVGWVLWLGPMGIFALAFVIGARAGAGAVGALFHYVAIMSATGALVWLLAYPLARFGGRKPLGSFARAIAPAQAVAVSTQSSLASLPPMLASADCLGVPVHVGGVVLPLAVALFRATGPAMNLGVALYIAHWFGLTLSPFQVAAGVAAAAITTVGAVSLPGQVSFVSSIAPIALVMGIPIEPLALLIAVEPLPDMMRTVGNVTMDVAVTTVAARGAVNPEEELRETDGLAP